MDATIVCVDCGSEFTFTESEQSFYAEKNFSQPRRCSACRAAKKAQRDSGGGYSNNDRDRGSMYGDPARIVGGGSREMFSATCSQCGKEALVPFHPSPDKPVYCSDCFRERRG